MFVTLVIHVKLYESIKFVCRWESGGTLLPDNMVADRTGVTEETVATVLVGKHPLEKLPHSSTLEVYKKIIFLSPWVLWGV